MSNHKHLTFDDRSYTHASLNAGHSFRYITNHLDKDPSTISKEVRHHQGFSEQGFSTVIHLRRTKNLKLKGNTNSFAWSCPKANPLII